MHAIEELKARLSELENKKRDWNEGVKRKDELVNKLNSHKKKLLELKKRYDPEAKFAPTERRTGVHSPLPSKKRGIKGCVLPTYIISEI